MKRTRALAAAILALAAMPAVAEEYPAKPIRIVVSFPPGTTPDLTARAVGPALQQALGQPVIVDNKSGAGGNIGADFVAKSPPDGYTLKDLAPISLLTMAPQILVIAKELPIKSVPEFIAYARANPGKLSYGTTG